MSSSYQGTEFAVEGQQQPFIVEKPISTSVRSKSAIDIVAESLASINPAINAMLNLNIKKAVAEEKQKGFNLAVRENRREGGFKTVVDELRKNQEDGVTNRFIAGSIFAQDAFNETIFSKYGNKMFLIIILLYIFLIFSFNRIKNE